MTDLREFLRHHIEAFLDHEFGPVTEHNVTPPGVRRPVWTPDHTERLVAHLAGNWAPVEGVDVRFMESHQRAMEKVAPGPGEVAADNALADAAAATFDATPEGEKPPVNTEVPW